MSSWNIKEIKNQGERPAQRVNYCKCPVQVNLLEQDDHTWIVTFCNLKHEGHPVSAKNFYSHAKNKKLDDEDLEYVKGLVKAKVNARNISRIMVNRTGKDFSYKDVVNLLSKM